MENPKFHVAIIMDGNGRWALKRGLPRSAGHRAGAKAVRQIVEAAAGAGIDVMTLYAFSSDNWARPTAEVQALMGLLERYLMTEGQRCVENDIRVNVIGRRDRLGNRLMRAIHCVESLTSGGKGLLLRLAVDYSARHAILTAANRSKQDHCDTRRFARSLNLAMHSCPATPEVDLLIRTGGERRLSDFMLWECAYAELVFTPCYWPDFGPDDLATAIREYGTRQRRFGGLPEQEPPEHHRLEGLAR
jgi:undecaprenyl diphosphate synthase